MKIEIGQKLSDYSKSALINLLEQRLMVWGITIQDSELLLPGDVDSARYAGISQLVSQYVDYASRLKLDRLYEQGSASVPSSTHLQALQASGAMLKLGDGLYTFQGSFLTLVNRIDGIVRAWAMDLGAQEQDHPVLWPMDLLQKIHYLHEFPQLAYLVTGANDDFESCSRLSFLAQQSVDGSIVVEPDVVKPFQFGLQNAVCDCCYYGLEARNLAGAGIFTTSNKVIRNERKSTERWGRLRCFRVRDIMVVGHREDCEAVLETVFDRLVDLLRTAGIHARIETANDPFFGDETALKSVFQNSRHLKYEVITQLDEDGPDLAIGSINRHQDFFSKAFDIKIQDKRAMSACVGIGLERFAMALFAHYGDKIQHWPDEVRKAFWNE